MGQTISIHPPHMGWGSNQPDRTDQPENISIRPLCVELGLGNSVIADVRHISIRPCGVGQVIIAADIIRCGVSIRLSYMEQDIAAAKGIFQLTRPV